VMVTPAAASALFFTVQPSTASAGAPINPAVRVTVRDNFGNTAAFTGNVTITIGTNPSAGTLSGTSTKPAAGGVASFADLSINNAGAGYTLVASAAGLPSRTSAAFSINQ
jgi:hypothetical protein